MLLTLSSHYVDDGNCHLLFVIVLFQSFVSLSDVNHNRKWDERDLEQREDVQEGKKYDYSFKSLAVFGFICLLRRM